MSTDVSHAEIPATGLELLHGPHVGHVSFIDDDGRIVTCILWVHERDGRVLTSSPVGSAKGHAWRRRPQVSVSVVDPANQFHYVAISGEVTAIRPDEGLAFIDEMSRLYMGSDYGPRGAREVFEITPTKVRASTGTW
jgi:PPOX class probable F420-dependent enzyme